MTAKKLYAILYKKYSETKNKDLHNKHQESKEKHHYCKKKCLLWIDFLADIRKIVFGHKYSENSILKIKKPQI